MYLLLATCTVSPLRFEVPPLGAASGVGRPRPRLYKGWAAWNTISLQLDAELVTQGGQHVALSFQIQMSIEK